MEALSAHKVRFQAHIYPEGGHGMSRATRLTSDISKKLPPKYIAGWMEECIEWFLRTVGYDEN